MFCNGDCNHAGCVLEEALKQIPTDSEESDEEYNEEENKRKVRPNQRQRMRTWESRAATKEPNGAFSTSASRSEEEKKKERLVANEALPKSGRPEALNQTVEAKILPSQWARTIDGLVEVEARQFCATKEVVPAKEIQQGSMPAKLNESPGKAERRWEGDPEALCCRRWPRGGQ